MKRNIIIALLAALIFPVAAMAQVDGNGTRPMFGIKVGFDVNIPGRWHNSVESIDMYRHGYGFNAGGVCNLFLGRGFYLEPGVSLYCDRYSFKGLIAIPDGNSGEGEKDPAIEKIGLRVPVMAGYSFFACGCPLSVYTGPELNWSFAGGYKMKNEAEWGDLPESLYRTQRRVDCAWRVGLGAPVGPVFVSIDAAIGLTDLMKSSDLTFRENRVTVGATYYF